MITQLQKATAQAIVAVFETGTVRGGHQQSLILPDRAP